MLHCGLYGESKSSAVSQTDVAFTLTQNTSGQFPGSVTDGARIPPRIAGAVAVASSSVTHFVSPLGLGQRSFERVTICAAARRTILECHVDVTTPSSVGCRDRNLLRKDFSPFHAIRVARVNPRGVFMGVVAIGLIGERVLQAMPAE